MNYLYLCTENQWHQFKSVAEEIHIIRKIHRYHPWQSVKIKSNSSVSWSRRSSAVVKVSSWQREQRLSATSLPTINPIPFSPPRNGLPSIPLTSHFSPLTSHL